MAASISVAKEWFVSMSEGRMLLPEQEVRILVLSGLTKQPIFVPSLSSSWQKNCISSWGTVDEMLSMYAKRWAMLPTRHCLCYLSQVVLVLFLLRVGEWLKDSVEH